MFSRSYEDTVVKNEEQAFLVINDFAITVSFVTIVILS